MNKVSGVKKHWEQPFDIRVASSLNLGIKGTHTIYFSSSFYIINQKPMIPRTYFHCITHGLHILLSEIWQCICLFCGFVLTNHMAILFNINI